MHWIILTGEYPPRRGGVSDYSFRLAHGLLELGDDVEVCTPCGRGDELGTGRVRVQRLPDHFGWHSFRLLGRAFRALPVGAIVLIQYVPHAYGWKAMNFPFALWVWMNRRRVSIWTYFHEVAYPREKDQPWRQRIIALVTRMMAGLVARASARIYLSIPAWEESLREVAPIRVPVVWMPVPSNMPGAAEAAEVAKIRATIGRNDAGVVVGHFGTFGSHSSTFLGRLLPALLLSLPEVAILLIGRGSEAFIGQFGRSHSILSRRIHAADNLPAQAVANHVGACDLLVQPYVDGVSSRRTTAMTGLALGIPVVTNDGPLTEPLWRKDGAVSLAPSLDVATFVELVEGLVKDEAARRSLGDRGRILYDSRFDMRKTLRQLHNDASQVKKPAPASPMS